MRENEFLFKLPITNTRFQAFFSKMECVLPLNGVHFGAKCNAFLVQNGVRFGAKCKVKWYKMEGKMVLNAR